MYLRWIEDGVRMRHPFDIHTRASEKCLLGL